MSCVKEEKEEFEQHYETDTDNYCIYLHLYNDTVSNGSVKGGRSLSGNDVAENYQPSSALQGCIAGSRLLFIHLAQTLMFWKKKRALQAVVSR